MELKVSPEHPSMAKPMTFTLHITDEHAQPVNGAEVNGALTMKVMDMGTTQLKFTPKGNGDYEASHEGYGYVWPVEPGRGRLAGRGPREEEL